MPTYNQIVTDLAGILADFNGREYTGPIDETTLFMQDLGFNSIDVVVLGETLENFYGKEIPFGDLVSELGQQNLQDLQIGVLSNFLIRHL